MENNRNAKFISLALTSFGILYTNTSNEISREFELKKCEEWTHMIRARSNKRCDVSCEKWWMAGHTHEKGHSNQWKCIPYVRIDGQNRPIYDISFSPWNQITCMYLVPIFSLNSPNNSQLTGQRRRHHVCLAFYCLFFLFSISMEIFYWWN